MVLQALKSWGPSLAGHRVIVFTDNKATRAFINKQRAPRTIHGYILRSISEILVMNDIDIYAEYIPGHANDLADSISRLNENGQLLRFVSLLTNFYEHCIGQPVMYWLPNHMSMCAYSFLLHQIQKVENLYNTWTARVQNGVHT